MSFQEVDFWIFYVDSNTFHWMHLSVVGPRPERETRLWKLAEASFVKENKVFFFCCYVYMDLKRQVNQPEGKDLTANMRGRHISTTSHMVLPNQKNHHGWHMH